MTVVGAVRAAERLRRLEAAAVAAAAKKMLRGKAEDGFCDKLVGLVRRNAVAASSI